MALIKCPECGREVSSNAVSCPVCGYPIAANSPSGEVAIKIGPKLAGTVMVYNMEDNSVVWEGKGGEIARFHIDKPMQIGIANGFKMFGINPPKKANGVVHANRKYSHHFRSSELDGCYVLTEVDVIDSE